MGFHRSRVLIPLKYGVVGALCWAFSTLSISAQDPEFLEKVYLTRDQALRYMFPNATTIRAEDYPITGKVKVKLEAQLGFTIPEKSVTVFCGYDQEKFLRYAIILNEMGKHYPITLIVGLNAKAEVEDVAVMIYREKIGSEVKSRRFLKQFMKKTSRDALEIDQDIIGLTGATISSWSVTSAVRKAILFTEALKLNRI